MTEARQTASQPTKTGSQTAARRPRFRYFLLVGLILVVLAAYFAPTLVAVTPLRQRIIPGLFPKLAARSQVGSASLGWFAPVVLYDVRIDSESGEPLLDAVSVTSEHSLLGLIADQTHLGRFDIDGPHAHVLLRDDGSNIEDAIAPMLADEEPGKPKEFSLQIRDAAIDVREVAEGGKWRLSGLASKIDLPLADEKSISVQADVAVGETVSDAAPQATANRSLSLAVKWHPADSPLTAKAGSGEFELDAEQIPLVFSRGLLRRFVGDVRLAGEAVVKCSGKWSVPQRQFDLRIGQLRGEDLQLSAPEFLAEEEVRLNSLRASGGVVFHQQQVSLDTLALETAPANITASGRLNLEDLRTAELLDALFAQQIATTGQIDLAQLAALLPKTLHVRDGTRITSGQVAWDLTSREEAGRRRLIGRLDATGLAAENAGQTITWQQPVQMTLAIEQTAEGPVVEQLKCSSNFLQVNGSGTPRQASLTADCSLDQLRSELGRFVDLGEFEINGQLSAKIGWQRTDEGDLTADGEMNIEDLALSLPGMRPWREPRLKAVIGAAGRYDEQGTLRLDRAEATVQAGEDVLRAELLEPVADAASGAPLPVQLQLQGRIAAWLARAQLWLPLEGWQMDGQADLNATARVSQTSLAVSSLKGKVEQLSIRGGGLFIDEPLVELTATDLTAASGEDAAFAVVDATLATYTISFRAENVHAATTSQGPTVAGNVAFRCDLDRLSGWFEDPQSPLPVHYFGEATGALAVNLTRGVSSADMNIGVKDFVAARQTAPGQPWQPLWREPEVKIVGQASYDSQKSAAGLNNLSVQSSALSVTASGQVADLSQRVNVDLDGQLAYDLERISPVLKPYLGDDFLLTGKKNESFSVHGPVLAAAPTNPPASVVATTAAASPPFSISTELKAQAGLGWDSADAFALKVGPGNLNVALADGVAQVTPIDLPVSGGRVQFAPQFLLNRQPMLMVAGKGQVFENVAITPIMCRTWLKYVAPLVADATEVKGTFSTTLEGATVPLTAPMEGAAKGALTVHSAEVGPGPLGRQVLLLARQIEHTVKGKPLQGFSLPQTVWMSMPEQTIDFQMADRGVRHQNMRFQVGDVEVRTEGLVNFDQSIDLLATVPIRDEWTTQPWLRGMKGKSLQLPLKGTLTEPKLDDRVWRELTSRMVQGAAERLLDRGLQKLFGPKN
ncbi:MAG: hypothetical protein RIC55_15000 [Pirellulaceae bacterium]